VQRVHEKLRCLRYLGIRYREPCGQHWQSCSISEDAPLVSAYSLFLTANALRQHVSGLQDSGLLFHSAHELVSKALQRSLDFCDLAKPRGVEAHLRRAVSDELVLVDICAYLVPICYPLANSE
jgi:hypothetical protein